MRFFLVHFRSGANIRHFVCQRGTLVRAPAARVGRIDIATGEEPHWSKSHSQETPPPSDQVKRIEDLVNRAAALVDQHG